MIIHDVESLLPHLYDNHSQPKMRKDNTVKSTLRIVIVKDEEKSLGRGLDTHVEANRKDIMTAFHTHEWRQDDRMNKDWKLE